MPPSPDWRKSPTAARLRRYKHIRELGPPGAKSLARRHSSRLVHVLNLVGDLRASLQHRRYRTVLVFREFYRILHCLWRYFTAHPVDELDFRVDGRRLGSAFGFGADFQAGKWLALFSQDTRDIVSGAAAQSDQY